MGGLHCDFNCTLNQKDEEGSIVVFTNIRKTTVEIYLFTVLFPVLIYITSSSSVPVIPVLVLFVYFIMYITENNLTIRKDIDTIVITTLIFYNLFLSIIGALSLPDEWLSVLYSQLATMLLVMMFYVSRNIKFNLSVYDVVNITLYSAFFFVLYSMYELWSNGAFYREGIGGRFLNQRDGVFVNYILLFSLWGLASSAKVSVNKLMLLVVFICSFILMLFSYSKGAYLLLALDTILLFFVYRKSFYSLIVACMAFGVIFFAVQLFNDYESILARSGRLLAIFEGNYDGDGSTVIRIEIWKWVINYLLQNPFSLIFGTGHDVSAFDLSLNVHNHITQINSAESMYLDILLRNGLIGIVLYLFIFYRITFFVYRLKKFDNNQIYDYLMIFIIGTAVFNVFEPSLRDRGFGMFFYFMYGYLAFLHESYKQRYRNFRKIQQRHLLEQDKTLISKQVKLTKIYE